MPEPPSDCITRWTQILTSGWAIQQWHPPWWNTPPNWPFSPHRPPEGNTAEIAVPLTAFDYFRSSLMCHIMYLEIQWCCLLPMFIAQKILSTQSYTKFFLTFNDLSENAKKSSLLLHCYCTIQSILKCHGVETIRTRMSANDINTKHAQCPSIYNTDCSN